MSAPALYEISNDFRAVRDMEQLDLDTPPEVFKDTLDALTGDFEQKAVAVVQFTLNQAALADAIDEAADKMKARAASIRRNRVDGVRNYLQFHMQATGITRIECEYFTINLRNNPESVKIADGVELPAEYMVQKPPPAPTPDKTKLKADLKAGKIIDGCWLEQGQRLEVKV